ncbi:MAG: NYN domain-containing protein [Candidatus Omnitrophica bacterium]|nr:NYN domain-containing protein [Candidatus Omnitrophota bacterium]MDD5500662.1 NYN domain-containing protein [Candidatus Omnitrophota bacterium]
MSLRYIVDAYNMINHPGFKPRPGKACNIQTRLADFIRGNRLSGSRKNSVVLVFDGYPPAGERMPEGEGLICVFSRGIEADEAIKRIVEKSALRKEIVVVSDDKEVRYSAKLLKAQVSSVEGFIGSSGRNIPPRSAADKDSKDISCSAMEAINAELKKKWLE